MWKLAITVATLIAARVVYKIYKKQAYCASCGTCYPESAEWVKCSACEKKNDTVEPVGPIERAINEEMRALHAMFDEISRVLDNDHISDHPKKADTKESPEKTSI